MKNLDLNAYGVSEMSENEMRDANGGIMLALVCLVVMVAILFIAGMTEKNESKS